MKPKFNKIEDKDIVMYLDDIKDMISNEVGVAIKAYWDKYEKDNKMMGYFSVLRMLFPEIDGLGSYLTGNPMTTGYNIKTYLQKIMSKIDDRYSKFAGFIALIHRNGLMHQHSPKQFMYKKRRIGWELNFHNGGNDQDHLYFRNDILIINLNLFFEDLVNSIDILKTLIKNEYCKTFMNSITIQREYLTKYSILKSQRKIKNKNRRYIYPKDLEFIK